MARTIKAHIDAVKQRIPSLRKARPIIIPESNIPVALDIQWQLKTYLSVDCVFMTEDNDRASTTPYDMPGSMTTKYNKPIMINTLKRYLELGHIVFSEPFVSADETTGNTKDIRKEFINQMYNFAKITVTRIDQDGSPAVKIYHSGKAAGGNDDFVMALAIGIHMYGAFKDKQKYRHFH